MASPMIYPIGISKACQYAVSFLTQDGFDIVDHPTPEATHLLLDVPSFGPDGKLRSGEHLQSILDMLPHSICVIGGNLHSAALAEHNIADLLSNANYLAQNAAITAECALQTALPLLETTLYETKCLVLGWGRIGKCLCRLLSAIRCPVTVAARKEQDRAIIRALGFHAADYPALSDNLSEFDLIFNTVPAPILSPTQLSHCPNCVKIDLASSAGLTGDDIIHARGLPGICAPRTSGRLIADAVRNYIKEGIV